MNERKPIKARVFIIVISILATLISGCSKPSPDLDRAKLEAEVQALQNQVTNLMDELAEQRTGIQNLRESHYTFAKGQDRFDIMVVTTLEELKSASSNSGVTTYGIPIAAYETIVSAAQRLYPDDPVGQENYITNEIVAYQKLR
jgi:hypothetical protein